MKAVGSPLERNRLHEEESKRFIDSVNAALAKHAKQEGYTLVLLKDGLATVHPTLKWKNPPSDVSAEIARLLDTD